MLRVIKMQLELVDCWFDFCSGEDFLQLHLGKVGYADGFHFAVFECLFHLFPCVLDGPGTIDVTCPIREKRELSVIPVWVQLLEFD